MNMAHAVMPYVNSFKYSGFISDKTLQIYIVRKSSAGSPLVEPYIYMCCLCKHFNAYVQIFLF